MADEQVKVTIEDLVPTAEPSRSHVLPAMLAGSVSKLSVDEILSLTTADDVAGLDEALSEKLPETIAAAAVDDTFDDSDQVLYLTGSVLKLGGLAGLIASIFKTARTIANAQFAADTFRLFNAAGTPRSLKFNIDALTVGRTVTVPDAGVDLGRVNNLLGYDQTWQDVIGSRTVNTAYQNTTGKPILVNITWSTASGVNLQVSTNGSTWVTVGNSSNSAGTSVSAVVPPGHYYRINGAISVNVWSELR